MNRRGFLGSILALGAAPAIVRADSLMRIVAPGTTVVGIPGNDLWAHAHMKTFDPDEFLRIYLRPAIIVLASGIESDVLAKVRRGPMTAYLA